MQAQCHAGDTKTYEQIIRKFLARPLAGGEALYAVPLQCEAMHKKACRTIYAATAIVHLQSRGNSIILVPTQINVYFVWLAWMQAMHSATLQPMQPNAFADYFKRMAPDKIVVLLPVVCLWVCVKCMEAWELGSKDMLRIIQGVQQVRNYRVHITLEDVVHAEHVLLQLIGFDVLKHQESIDRIEDILGAHLKNFDDMYVSADAPVVRSLFGIFCDVCDIIE
jgi:hypothetical protein